MEWSLLREAQGRWGRGGGRGGAGITTSVVDATATTLRVYARTGYYVLNHGAFPGKYLVLQCHSMFLVSLFFQAYVSGDVPFFLHGCSMRFCHLCFAEGPRSRDRVCSSVVVSVDVECFSYMLPEALVAAQTYTDITTPVFGSSLTSGMQFQRLANRKTS